jgi:hypothetical protein
MKARVYGVLMGLLVAGLLVGVYEFAGGDATLVVMLILLTTYLAVRLDRVEELFHDLIDDVRQAQQECGHQFPLTGGQFKTCVRRLDHHDPWHRSTDGMQWITTTAGGGGGGGKGLGNTEPQA